MSIPSCERLTVSVIIPTYNRAGLVTAAIESALEQSRVPDEILVIDDGSTDDTLEVLSQFSAPVRVVSQPNRGRSAARNAGLAAAASDAVIFLDSDDLLLPKTIERCAGLLERQPEVDVVYGDAEMIDAQGRPMGLYSDRMPGTRPSGNILGELARRCCLTISSMVRRSALSDISFEGEMEFGEDYDFWRQLAAQSLFAYIDQPLMCYRHHEGMTIAGGATKTLDGELEVQRRILAMPEFAALSRRERAQAYTAHGAKQAMRNRGRAARQMLLTAIRTDPGYPTSYALLALCLFSVRPLQMAINSRRRLIGNHIAADAGAVALAEQHAPGSKEPLTAVMTDRDTVAIVKEHVYG
jgi:hypothetical protein